MTTTIPMGFRGMLVFMPARPAHSNDETAQVASIEDELVARARAGDTDAFDQLVSTHLKRVWNVVWRIVRHDQDAEDVVQEVFLTAHRSLSGFRGQAKFSTWLHKIAVTRALNHLDRSAEKLRRSSRSMDQAPDDDEESVPIKIADPTTPLHALEERELSARLADCMDKLPPAWRGVLILREGEDRSYDDIAGILNVAIGTVRSRLARAREALKRCLSGETP